MLLLLQVGLGKAVQYCQQQQITRSWPRIQSLAAFLRLLLAEAGAQVHDHGAQLCGLVSFTIPGVDPDQAMTQLAAGRGSTTVGASASSSAPAGHSNDQREDVGDGQHGGASEEQDSPVASSREQQQQVVSWQRPVAVSVSWVSSTRLDYEARGLPPAILRASTHYYNSVGDLEEFIAAVKELMGGLLETTG